MQAQFQIGNGVEGESLGNAVSYIDISDNGQTIAIGETLADGLGSDQGLVRVFQLSGNTWIQKGQNLYGSDGANLGRVSLSGDGNRLIVGPASLSFDVQVFEYDGSSWVQVGMTFTAANAGNGLSRVDMSSDGSRIALGAIFEDTSNGTSSGQVSVYQFSGGTLVPVGNPIIGLNPQDYFGGAVSLNAGGTRIAIGSSWNDDGGNNAGQVRSYQFDGTNWSQMGNPINGVEVNQFFGNAVDLSADGDRLIIGTAGLNVPFNDAGAILVYDWDGSDWIQAGSTQYGNGNNEQFGLSVGISSNGQKIVAGRPNTQVGSLVSAGKAVVFKWEGSDWQQVGASIDGQDSGDRCGVDVDITSDGNFVGVVSPGYGIGNQGQVRVFNVSEGSFLNVDGLNLHADLIANAIQIRFSLPEEGFLETLILHVSSNGTEWDPLEVWSNAESIEKIRHYTDFESGDWYFQLELIDHQEVSVFSNVAQVRWKAEAPLSFYPNPADQFIQFSDRLSGAIRVIDALGQFVMNLSIQDGQLDISQLPKGLYWLTDASEKVYPQPLIKL